MQILVACEESQAVTIALKKLGHEAYNGDLIPCSGGHPEWHIQQDVLPLLNGYCFFKTCDGSAHYVLGRWYMLIAFPPCTDPTNASAVRMRVKGEIVAERYAKAMEAKAFFMSFLSADCAKIAVENPTPSKIVELPPTPKQYSRGSLGTRTQSGHACGSQPPLLVPTEIITEGVTPWVNGGCKDAHGELLCSFKAAENGTPSTGPKLSPVQPQWRNNGPGP
ncbi:MAG: DNA cytosine methyltransferase [Oscillospiraceae bacterium]